MSDRLDAALAELAAALREEIALASSPVPNAPERLHDIRSASALLGVGRSLLYSEIGAGRLSSLKCGRRRLVSDSALREFVASRSASPSSTTPQPRRREARS